MLRDDNREFRDSQEGFTSYDEAAYFATMGQSSYIANRRQTDMDYLDLCECLDGNDQTYKVRFTTLEHPYYGTLADIRKYLQRHSEAYIVGIDRYNDSGNSSESLSDHVAAESRPYSR